MTSIFFLVPRNGPTQNRAHHAWQGRELEKCLSLVGVELQRDFEHFGRFGNSVGRPEDWCSGSNADGMLGY